MAIVSDTDINHALLLSKLSPNPVKITDNFYMWNGYIVNRSTAVVVFLKLYSKVPVNDQIRKSLYEEYLRETEGITSPHLCQFDGWDDDDCGYGNWFYHVCSKIKNKIDYRSQEEIRQVLAMLHS